MTGVPKDDPFESTTSNAELVLDDGTTLKGISFGADISVSGEAVFQTGQSPPPFVTVSRH